MDGSRTLERPPAVERSLAFLVLGAALAFCYVARELLVPSALAVILAITVHPLVSWLRRRGSPLGLAALAGTVVATAVVAAIGLLLYGRVATFLAELPGYEGRIREAVAAITRHIGHFQAQSEQFVRSPGAVRVDPGVPWGALVLGTAQGAATIVGGAAVAVFVLYFALADGPRFREKFLAHAGSSPRRRERAVAALDELHRDVAQYMLNRVVLNAVLGVVVWIVYAIYGLDHAAVWGITTALLHFVPYVGPAVGLLFPVAMAILQYASLKHVLLVGGIYTALVSLQGNVVDPIFLGRQLRLNATAVFLGSLFWFWMWGPVGLFLAVPLLSTIRIVCKYLPRFRVISDFLAE